MRHLNRRFDAGQLLSITKNCCRWSGIESLPPAIRDSMAELDALTERLRPRAATRSSLPRLVATIEHACAALKSEFSKAQISFICPTCPLRAKS